MPCDGFLSPSSSPSSSRLAAPIAATPLSSLPEPLGPLVLPGVDSIFAAEAERLATVALVDNRQREAARRAVDGGVKLLDMADSLSARFAAAPPAGAVTVDAAAVNQATELFNEGARLLQPGEDPPGLIQLIEAESAFRRALVANPHDEEAHYWLSRVYEMQYERLGQAGAVNDAIEVLQRLVEMHPHVHDYAALLAETTQASGAHEAGGGLCTASPALAGMSIYIYGRTYCTGGVAGGMCNPQRILRVVTGTLRVKLA